MAVPGGRGYVTAPGCDSLRSAIRQEIASIHPLDSLEEAHRADALAWVDSDAGLFRVAKPDLPPKHLVSYFALVDGEHILLVDHRLARLWLPTGGHVEPGEHPRETVARELREELGLSLQHELAPPAFITCTTTVGATAGHTDVSLWYVVNGCRSSALNFDANEFAAVRWFHRSEVPLGRADPHLERFLKKLVIGMESQRTGD
jgi:8-oxo-dGTP diphosphatase